MNSFDMTGRDRFKMISSVLYCVIGAVLIARFLRGSLPLVVAILGIAFLGLGVCRLILAGKEIRKRVRSSQ
jgi:uncharacterized membrane protein HdeD (DUF308 family)